MGDKFCQGEILTRAGTANQKHGGKEGEILSFGAYASYSGQLWTSQA